ncbi:sodium- and chloride-dependent GABA transporter ine-like [Alosa alosa]|uniref:sodium- and chloride-dependent GABA transporter ine-like n=1 Tax=Alosa alosa TaxID=278164 RepID=UPI0020150B79|nr:sodium- and chloride-dependent GABA transporter ine-like [Alosa alosa]
MDPPEGHGAVLVQQRATWSRRLEFLLASLGYAVGLGNVWRFPYLCYRSGGGAFFIPYIIMLFLCALPMLLMEFTIGQFTQSGPIHAFMKICPLLKGVGLGTLVVSFVISAYFNTLMSWTLFYLFNSFKSPLPWQTCNNTWNVPESCSAEFTVNDTSQQSASQQFFNYRLLDVSEGLEHMGSVRWEVLGCLILAWAIEYLSIFKGIKLTGKVVYFTALFPYTILIILLVFTCRLPGAADGALFFLTPKWHKLKEVQVWIDALSQVFFSIGVGFGVMISMASYNNYNNNILRDSLIVALANSATSIFSGFVVFSALGYMAHIRSVSVEDLAVGGPGLAFLVYPEILATMPVPQLWAFLFFLMLLCLGLDSQFAHLELIATTMMDCVGPKIPPSLRRREVLVLLVCLPSFLVGLPCVFQGGVYVFQLMDHYTVAVAVLVMTVMEIAAISWILGVQRFSMMLTSMLGKSTNMYFKICWMVLTPLLVLAVLVASIVQHTPPRYGKWYQFPDWSKAVGWMLTMASIICIPLGALHELYTRKGSLMERLRSSVTPSLELDVPPASHQEQEICLSSRFEEACLHSSI